jgi:hypothetical protein
MAGIEHFSLFMSLLLTRSAHHKHILSHKSMLHIMLHFLLGTFLKQANEIVCDNIFYLIQYQNYFIFLFCETEV